MKENTNKVIAVNTLILYIRLALVSLCGLLYTRFSLQALGANDYGLFAVVGCIITFACIINTVMIVTSNRFMAMAIGKRDREAVCRTFNVNIIIHFAIAILTLLIALPIGHWYITNHVNYNGNIANVHTIFDISIIASAISFIGVPFNGLLLAKEKFIVFCTTDVLSSIFKLIFTYILIDHFEHKLLIYAAITAFMTAFPTFVFWLYCRHKFKEITKFSFVKRWTDYKEVIVFSIAIGYGAIALIAQNQGGALLINTFFSTAMNAGLAVATSVTNILQTFANNCQKSISPQVVKSYASGNQSRYLNLVCLSSKVTYFAMLFISVPFLLVPETIMGIWLKEIPPFAILFMRLLIVNMLINSINAGLADFVFATGKIRLYQFVVNTLIGVSVIVGYIFLKLGHQPENLIYVYIAFSTLVTIVRPFLIKRISSFDISSLIRGSYLPAILSTTLFCPIWLLKAYLTIPIYLATAYVYLITICYLIALNKSERSYINEFIRNKKIKKK